MRISDLALELKISEEQILSKLKTLKLKAKGEAQELNTVVEIVLRDEFAKEGIVSSKKVELPDDDDKPKKKAKAAKTPKSAKAADEDGTKAKSVKASKSKAKSSAAKTTKAKSKAKGDEEEHSEPEQSETEAPVGETKDKQPEKPKVEVAPVIEKPKEVVPPPVVAPQVKLEPVPPAKPVVIETPKISTSPAPVEQATNIIPIKKKVTKSPEPFITVKPLVKKRRRPMGPDSASTPLSHGRGDVRSEATPGSSAPVLAVPGGPLVDIELKVPISVKDLAVRLDQKTNSILKQLMSMGIFANINQNLGEDIVRKLVQDFGFNLVLEKSREEQLVSDHQRDLENPELLKSRAPVVTFMGHVDHGKTSLLDRIRSSKVADREHGGITQHIGAYSVTLPKGTITFLDTPGHEAFTAMRARGAHITDLVVLVVAADEGIMPQTEEAIDHARAANVPIIVALNKIDRKNADIERVKKQLADHDLLPEDWGGKTIVVGVSAHTGQGIDDLLDMILLEAEILELKANYDKKANGIVVESHLSRGRGTIATLIVQGVLREGDFVVVGPYYGKIKAMFDDLGRSVKEAGPSRPVEALGLPEVPDSGEMFYVVDGEKQARDIAFTRAEKLKEQRLSSQTRITLEDLYTNIQKGTVKELNVILKADVHGSLEAVRDSLLKIPSDEVKIKFIHTGVGEVNMSDVLLAKASNAIIIAFNIGVDAKAREEIENSGVDLRKYRIIYDAVNDLRQALEGLLAPKLKRKFLGRIEIRQVMKLSKSGIVAGCYVQKGKVRSKSNIDILRNGEVVFTGTISSLKRFKDDVKEVGEGFECGITISNFTTIEVGDIMEAFEVEEIARKL